MKIFIWKKVTGVTKSWHDEAGLVVVAVSLEAAKFLVANSEDTQFGLELSEPDAVYDIANDVEPSVIIFPDSGCC